MTSRWKDTLCGSRIKNLETDSAINLSSKPSEVLSCEGKFYAKPEDRAFVKPFSVTLTLATGIPEFVKWHSVDQQTHYSFSEEDYKEEIEIPEAAMVYFENKYMK